MRKIFVATAIVIALGTFFVLSKVNEVELDLADTQSNSNFPDEILAPKVDTNPKQPALQQTHSVLHKKTSRLTTDESNFSGIAKHSDKAKSVLEKAGVLPQDLNDEAYLEFDLESLRGLEIGDTFNLEIPQTSETFAAEVVKVEKFNNGDKSVFGRLVGSDGVLHTTVLTVGSDALYGQLTAPSGNYVFETKGQYGWLAAKRSLYKNHVEFEAVRMEPPADGPEDVFAPQQENEKIN